MIKIADTIKRDISFYSQWEYKISNFGRFEIPFEGNN